MRLITLPSACEEGLGEELENMLSPPPPPALSIYNFSLHLSPDLLSFSPLIMLSFIISLLHLFSNVSVNGVVILLSKEAIIRLRCCGGLLNVFQHIRVFSEH